MAFGLTSGTTIWNTVDIGRRCASKTDRKCSTRLFRPLSIRPILGMSDGDIKDAERDISTNLQPSLPKQFAIEKAVADLKMPRSSLYRTVMFGLTSGRILWMCRF